MTVPTSVNAYSKLQQVAAADLNAIQDAIIIMWAGKHADYTRLIGPYGFIGDTGGSPALEAGLLYWDINASPEEVYHRLDVPESARVQEVEFFYSNQTTGGLKFLYMEENISTGAVSDVATSTPSGTGWTSETLSPASVLSSTDIAHIGVQFAAGSGGFFWGAKVTFDYP